MRAVIAFLLVPLMVVTALPSQLAVTGPNQGMAIYCSGLGCTAFGSSVVDLGNDNNWSLLLRVRFDPSLGDGNHDLFANTTLVSGAFTCAGIYIRAAKSGASWPVNVNITILGGVSSSNIYGTTGNLTAGPWYSIAVTHDSSHNWNTYINGTLDTSTNSNRPTIGTGCDMFVATVAGATDCGSGETGCWLNDIALFSSTLAAADIKTFAKGTRPNQLSVKPLAWYPMDGVCVGPLASGSLAADMSGNKHNLKMGNDPSPDYCAPGTSQTNGIVNQANGEATH